MITYTYSTAARAQTAKDLGGAINYVTAATYAPQGALSGLQNGASVFARLTYNSRLQPMQLFYTTGTVPPISDLQQTTCPTTIGTILHRAYNFGAGTNDNGNVLSITNCRDNNRTQNFAYDSLNRITQGYTTGTSWGEDFTIDPWGNLTNRSLHSGRTLYEPLNAAPANGKNQLPGFGYDAAGNMTSNGTATYAYDAENRLTGTAGWTYVYDGDGERVKKVNGSAGTLYWSGIGSDPIAESSLTGTNLEEYVFFNGKRIARRDVSPSAVHYYFSDHLGSASMITSNTGATQKESDYYPYGGEMVVTGSDANNYKFTGKERDSESGLDSFGRRHYASALGRWMSPDPINLTSARLVNPGNTLNKYVYGGNNPLKYIDRDGEDITIFYRPSGTSPTDFGHILIGALNQNTGQVGFLDYYPQGRGNGPGEFNMGNMQDRATTSDQFATLTIRTTPEEAQKVLDLIKTLTNGTPPDYATLSNNCTTLCEDVLRDLGLDFGDVLPDTYWADVYRNFSPAAQENPFKAFFIPRRTGVEYGNPRNYGMNFTQLLFQLYLNQWNQQKNNQKPPKACVTTYGPGGKPDTTCEE